MLERIKEIMIQKGLSPSAFADEIKVQRSSISHIIKGRNKPSLELIQKIISAFPDIDIEWLMTGIKSKPKIREIEHMEKKEIIAQPKASEICSNGNESDIEKIVFFYRDGSFKVYQSK